MCERSFTLLLMESTLCCAKKYECFITVLFVQIDCILYRAFRNVYFQYDDADVTANEAVKETKVWPRINNI